MGALFSANVSTAQSTQVQQQQTLQKISTGCNIGAIQSISDVDINLTGVNLPQGFTISQVMTASPSCILTNGAEALAQALQSSTISAAAKNAALSLGIVDINVAQTMSYEQLVQMIEQRIQSQCNITDTQDMHNITIAISDSNLGSFNITQNMNSNVNCAIESIVNANMEAQQTSQQTVGTGADWKSLLILGLVVVVVLVILGIGFYMYSKSQSQSTTTTGTTAVPTGGLPAGLPGALSRLTPAQLEGLSMLAL